MAIKRKKSNIRFDGDIAYVELTKGHEAIIDAEDAERVAYFVWYAADLKWGVYAQARRRKDVGKAGTIRLHRLILCAPTEIFVDHINNNPLDCRKKNLRLATPSQNSRNRRINSKTGSGAKGVYFRARDKKWQARIMVAKKSISLGTFSSLEAAKQAYADAAKELHGEFHRTE